MSKFSVKKLPPIRLVDLLKKRKTTLKEFINSSGIFTFVTLQQKCEKMGVSPPSENVFFEAIGNVVTSSPQEGVVVLDSPPLLKENTGEPIMVDDMGNVHTGLAKMPTIIDKVSKKKEKIEIDESIFITPIKTFDIELSGSNLGEATSVEDDVDSSVLKLSTLKN